MEEEEEEEKDLERFPNSMESNVGRMTWRESNLAAGARA